MRHSIAPTITEAIGVSHLYVPLMTAFRDAVSDAIAGDEAELEDTIPAAIRQVVRRHLGDRIRVVFDPELKVDAIAVGDTIRLKDTIRQNYADGAVHLRTAGVDVGDSPRMVHLIRATATLVIHELVHIQQHLRQAGREKMEYRSYLGTADEFEHQMRRAAEVGGGTPESVRLYNASPQEIPALAHEAALAFVDKHGLAEPRSRYQLAQLHANLHNLLTAELYSEFNKPSNTAEYAVFKRFGRLLYQEVIRFIERAATQKD